MISPTLNRVNIKNVQCSGLSQFRCHSSGVTVQVSQFRYLASVGLTAVVGSSLYSQDTVGPPVERLSQGTTCHQAVEGVLVRGANCKRTDNSALTLTTMGTK